MRNYINGLLLLSLLSACKVSKDVQTPKNVVPDTFRNAMHTADTTSIGDMQWKNFFADATLQNLIDSAIERNYDMQLAVKNIEASRLLFRQTKWNNVPQVDATLQATINRPSNNSLNGLSLSSFGVGSSAADDYTSYLSVSWEADIWGKIRSKSKAALAEYLSTIEAKKAVQTTLVNNVAQGYYNLLMLDEQLKIAQSNARLNDSTLRIIKLQYNSGQVTLLAVQQAEAQLLTAQSLVPQFEQNIKIQEDALSILAGRLPGDISRSATLDQFEVPATVSSGIPSSLLANRPDVKSAEYAIQEANANVNVNKAAMYPALRITASGGTDAFRASDWFNIPSSLFGIVAGSVVQPLLDHKELQTQYRVAEVNRDKSVIQFKQSVLNAVGEVSDALVKIDKLKQQQVIVQTQVNTLNKATQNANLLFQNGLATYLEVITAQSNVLQSQLQLATIKRDELSAVSDLYRSLGGGWR
ncbi:efflux transporter outer membrane subunit [Mucilaginibacter sp. E4BP6]|uniref:efflux transporter outer membrane subunit n=1 Tax=Mucilaginibacter sp. E4BP6 TaxID=2723089 RepID=UPI0015C87679|nr:TolC family protein [Mucilaginibacter sp. E4BP6]NYE66333.1 NodT family efflux transporter outer membrane factor (OMF) lipoprotein [Mucilaginibacter sp. E4BP6]